MVYDDSMNYIGCSHWREEEEIQEGVELKLDKGVLVDVGERTGETQTDLAPLLEKRRPGNASSPPRPPLRPIPLPATRILAPTNLQTRPKSLSDILGTSQGPVGRAKFPTQSPFEQKKRPPVQCSDIREPPAKRPRIRLNKGITEVGRDKIDGRERPLSANVVASVGRSGTSRASDLQTRRKAAPPKQVIDISSDAEPTAFSSPTSLSSSPLKAASRASDKARKALAYETPLQHLPETLAPAPREPSKTATNETSKVIRQKTKSSTLLPVAPGTLVDNVLARSSLSIGSSKNKLRLAVHKPRQKLMYRELLPSLNKPGSHLLNKSLADTPARTTVHKPPAVPAAEEETAQDTGPWSRVEAYLLLDWFPPDRERPTFEGQGQSPESMMLVNRGLLYDQIDAL